MRLALSALLVGLLGCEDPHLSLGIDHQGCTVDCLGAPCVGGRCAPAALVTGYDFPFPMVGGGEYAYFHAYNESALYRVNLSGVVERLAQDWPAAYSMVLRDGALFLGSKLGAGVLRVPLDGSPTEIVAGELRATHSLVSSGNELLVTATDEPGAGLYRLADAEGSAQLVAPEAALVDLAVTPGRAYASRYELGDLVQFDLEAGSTSVLVTGLSGPWGVAADEQYVYWTEHSGGRLSRLRVAGGGVDVLVDGLRGPHSLALDAETLYVTEELGGRVLAVRKDGSLPVVELASGMLQPKQVALWGKRLLWGTQGDGALWWVAR